jgi:hypothetical protein
VFAVRLELELEWAICLAWVRGVICGSLGDTKFSLDMLRGVMMEDFEIEFSREIPRGDLGESLPDISRTDPLPKYHKSDEMFDNEPNRI